MASIRVSGNIRRAWFKSVPPNLKPNDLRMTLTRTAFNCDDGTYRAEALTTVDPNGLSHSVPAEFYPDPWEPAVPDSLASGQLHYICAWKPK